jgi:uncharacterized protein (TIGR03437 family)
LLHLAFAFCGVVLPLPAQLLPRTAGIAAVALDPAGFIYVAGSINTTDLPVTPGVFQPTPPTNCLAPTCSFGYLAKVAPSGDALVWATYFYAGAFGSATRMAVGKDGNLYVASSAPAVLSLPPLGGYQTTPASIFIVEVSSDGKSLLAATYLGGAGDSLAALQLDAAGGVYIAGTARTAGFPTTPGAYQRQKATGPPDVCSGPADQFVAKFDRSLKTLVFSTLIGGVQPETADALAIGPDGSLYVTGTRGFIRGPCWEITFTRLTPDASAAIFSKSLPIAVANQFFGGYAIAVDSTGFAYVGGDNRDFIGPVGGAVVKFDPEGVQVGAQPIGGSIYSLALSTSEIVLAGAASTSTLTTTPGSPVSCAPRVGEDLTPYVARMSMASLQVTYSGFLPAGNLWLAGPDKLIASHPYGSTLPFSVMAPGLPAPGTVTCLANAATYSGYTYQGFQVAPGEVVSLFGNQIGPAAAVTAAFDAAGNITSELAGIQIMVGGLPAPLLYAAPNQINLVIPFGLAADHSVPFELRRNGSVVASFPASVVAQNPGLFTLDGTGTGLLAAVNQDGSVNSAAHPAGAGTAVMLFGTGWGTMTPLPVDGSRPPQAVNQPATLFQATVNGGAATIEYIGNAPTLVEGVVQINIRLPESLVSAAPLPPGVAVISIFGNNTGAFGSIAAK